MKIITIIGARPQFIKASILSNKIIQQNFFSEVIIHTGQHFDETMSDIFFEEMNIPSPNYNLGIRNANYSNMVGSMVNNIVPILKKEKPDAVLLYGDTNSCLSVISAKRRKIREYAGCLLEFKLLASGGGPVNVSHCTKIPFRIFSKINH